MKKKIIFIAGAVLVVVAGFLIYRSFSTKTQVVGIQTVKVFRGEISDIITATGRLEALMTVEVGTQVSGVIEKMYVDFNSLVKKGQLLAKLDETPLLANLDQSKASVDFAQAEVDYQKSNYDRNKVLADKGLLASADFELINYNYKKALANLQNAQSVYDRNKINLEYASIYSPIDGIILDRAVDEGQTVAASFSTPTLFTIANDLTQMQVEANVDEADIGKLKPGQRVEFTVDAYSDLKFDGVVTEIRLKPVESANVITYTVIINAPNPEKKLMPGMTANASFYVTEKKNIVLLPSKALNFNPDPKLWLTYQQNHPGVTVKIEEVPLSEEPITREMVWVKEGNSIHKQCVELGETDEINYEVISGLEEGDELIFGLSESAAIQQPESTTAQSPFMPTPPGGNRKK